MNFSGLFKTLSLYPFFFSTSFFSTASHRISFDNDKSIRTLQATANNTHNIIKPLSISVISDTASPFKYYEARRFVRDTGERMLWRDVGLLGEVFDGKLLKFLACVYIEEAEAFEKKFTLA